MSSSLDKLNGPPLRSIYSVITAVKQDHRELFDIL